MSATETQQAQYENELLLDGLVSNDPVFKKEAQDTLNDYVRLRMRERGLARKILPPEKKTAQDIDRQVGQERPTFVIDLEAETPAAVSIGFSDKPDQYYIAANRVLLATDRIVTNRFWKDVGEMMSWKMDIRTVVSDNAIKDMLAEEDAKMFRAVDNIVGPANTVNVHSGIAQHVTIPGGINRDSFMESLAVLPSTSSALHPTKIVMNHLTILQFGKWGRNEFGGDISEEIMRKGFADKELHGIPVLTTIKTNLVANNTLYYFADPKFMGRFYMLDDITMYTKSEYYFIEFMAYALLGMVIANTNAVAKVQFTQ